MEGDIARNQLIVQAVPIQCRPHGPQGGLAAADDGVGLCVLACDLNPRRAAFSGPERNSQCIEQFLDSRSTETNGQHTTRTGRALLQSGAVKNQPGRICQRKRTTRISGSHLARTVTDHTVRIDAPGPE